MSNVTLPEPLANAGFTPEQKEYLSGLFAVMLVEALTLKALHAFGVL